MWRPLSDLDIITSVDSESRTPSGVSCFFSLTLQIIANNCASCKVIPGPNNLQELDFIVYGLCWQNQWSSQPTIRRTKGGRWRWNSKGELCEQPGDILLARHQRRKTNPSTQAETGQVWSPTHIFKFCSLKMISLLRRGYYISFLAVTGFLSSFVL